MRKRIVALLLAVISVCSLFLFSCKKEMTDDERRKSIVEGGETAYTISVWLPVSEEVKERYQSDKTSITNIEREINKILAERNMATAIKFVLISEEEYVEKLTEQFEVSKYAATVINPKNEKYAETYKKQNNKGPLYPNAIGLTYINTAMKVDLLDSNGNATGEYVFELDYPDFLDVAVDDGNGGTEKKNQQVDICYIGSYEDLLTWANEGHLYSLSDYLSSAGGYTSLNKVVKQNYLNAMKVNDKIQALPNNHLYSVDKYQVVLLDKSVAGDKLSYDEDTGVIKYNDTEINSILGCKDYINDIGAEQNGVVPFVGTIDDASGVVYWNKNSIISSTINGDAAPENILENQAYVDYVTFYKELEALGYAQATKAEGKESAVEVKYATLAQIEEYEKDYYVIKSEMPVVDEISSMFAISQYSINYNRAMAVLNLFMTNKEIVTLLNYGVQGVDYKVENGTITNLNTFPLNSTHLGNGYVTYYNYNMSNSVWDYVKDVNYDAIVSPYIKANYAKTKYDVSTVTANYKAIEAVSAEIFSDIANMNAEEFSALVRVFGENSADQIAAKCELLAQETKYSENAPKIAEYEAKIAANNTRIEEIDTAMNASSEDDDTALQEEKDTLTAENTSLEELIKFVADYDAALVDKAPLEILNKFVSMQEYKDALAQSKEFYSKMN